MAVIKGKLKPGEKVVGRVVSVDGGDVTLKDKEGKDVVVTVTAYGAKFIDDNHIDDIVSIEIDADGDPDVNELNEFPA